MSDSIPCNAMGILAAALGFLLVRAATEAAGEVSRVVLRETAFRGDYDPVVLLAFGVVFVLCGCGLIGRKI